MTNSNQTLSKFIYQHRLWMLLVLVVFLGLGLFILAVHSILKDNVFGNDYLVFYHAGQAVLAGESPYSDQVTLLNQLGIYRQQAAPGQDPMPFVYPLYAIFPILPLAAVPYDWSYSVWLSINLFAVVITLVRVYHGSPFRLSVTALLLYPIVFGLILGNFTTLISMALLLTWKTLTDPQEPSHGSQVAIGCLLAWITIKPQFVWLLLGITLIASIKRRWWYILGSFVGAFALLWLISFAVMPGWFSGWLNYINVWRNFYPASNTAAQIISYLVPSSSAEIFSPILSVILLLFTAVTLWRYWTGRLPIETTLAWGGIASYLIRPPTVAYEQLIYILPLLFWFRGQSSGNFVAVLCWFSMILGSWWFILLKTLPAKFEFLLVIPFTAWGLYLEITHRRYATKLHPPIVNPRGP